MKHENIRHSILQVALELAKEKGYQNVRRDQIASELRVSPGLIGHYYGTMNQLKRAIIRHAATNGVIEVLTQGVVAGDRHAITAARKNPQLVTDHINAKIHTI